MLRLALTFLVICLAAAVLGFSGIAGATIELAKFLAILFGLLFLGFLLFGITGSKLAA